MGRVVGLAMVSPMEVGTLVASWWDDINDSTQWQDGIYYALCAAYALVSVIALIQLIRIELRVPEYGWTTQKVFHLMNFIVNGVRAIVFGFYKEVFYMHPKVLIWLLMDLPGLLFFSTYTLLVLFWAEIYHQARSLRADKLRLFYISVNGVIYLVQGGGWCNNVRTCMYRKTSPHGSSMYMEKEIQFTGILSANAEENPALSLF